MPLYDCHICWMESDAAVSCNGCGTQMCFQCEDDHDDDDCDEIQNRMIDGECKRRNVRRRVPVAW